MDKDTLKGKGKDIAGRVERQVGEWTDREDLQAEGAAKQAEGKVQKGIGKVKEAVRNMQEKMDRDREHERDMRNRKRKIA